MKIKIILMVLLSFVFCLALAFPYKSLPALGPLLSPFSGLWASHAMKLPEKQELQVMGLEQPVRVFWDEYGVPHIFAQSNKDLFRIQGYLAARQRLFQMDIQSRPGAGSIAELAGEKAREMDRFFIKIGMRQAAQRALVFILQDSESREALEAYTAGVNSYIQNLKPKDYPPEYKVLGAKPTLWSPLRTAHFLKTMSFNLAGRSYDLHLTRHLQKYGMKTTEFYFPNYQDVEYEELIFDPSDMRAFLGKVTQQFSPYTSQLTDWPAYLQPFATNGSNNFAVSAKKSATGYPILANDTHLSLTLPSIWYEVQLVSKNENVYGASFPGSPGVVLGFNAQSSWGVTNGTSDVIDWYEIEFRDATSDEYLYEGQWLKAEKSIETLKVLRGRSETIEMLWTRLGVVLHREGKLGLAMSWMAHRESNELKALLELARSTSVKSCMQANQYFKAPAQNFLCADASEIALRHQGRFPKRLPGQGKYVMDGRTSAGEWKEFLSEDEIPYVKSPRSGYLRSANDAVVNSSYPSFLGWDYEEGYRAKRIREVLESKEKLTAIDLINLQNDIYDSHAAEALPLMVDDLDKKSLQPLQQEFVERLKNWNFEATRESVEASLFSVWWEEFEARLYQDILGPRENNLYPRRGRTLSLLKKNHFEKASEAVNSSFQSAWKSLEDQHGADPTKWTWGALRPTVLRHVGRIPGFGSDPKIMPGTRFSPNANKGNHGATWKLVVEMGPDLKAWTSIPGHNEGHPFSPSYERFVDPWVKGEMKPVHFLKSESEAKGYSQTIFGAPTVKEGATR